MHFYLTAFALFPHLLNFAYGLSVRASKTTAPPISYGMVLYPNFEPADVFGPLDIFGLLSSDYRMRLSLIAATLDPVSTKPTVMNLSGSDFGESIVPTHTFSTPPEDIEVLFVPGGGGTRSDAFIGPAIGFVGRMYPKLKYLITVCNGATIGARSGVLDGRRATTSKRDWAWVTAQVPKVNWVPQARWVVDGNIWTSSGVMAGVDLTYAFVEALYGEEIASEIADMTEYVRWPNSTYDPFAAIWNVTKPSNNE